MTVSVVRLENRSLLHVGGPDAESFLQGLITYDLEQLSEKPSGFGALLSPQGKILFDFFVVPAEGGFLLDTLGDAAAALLKRLTMYKLRADVHIVDRTNDLAAFAVISSETLKIEAGIVIPDSRHMGMGQRVYVEPSQAELLIAGGQWREVDISQYDACRIGCGIPEAPIDYAFGNVFPHDVNLDQINAVGFEKGCFVGQEVVSRMKHRGTARRRIVQVSSNEDLPVPGTDITVEKRSIGTLGSVAGQTGLAQVRLDRVNDAMEEGHFIRAGTVQIKPAIPDWVSFRWT